MKLVFFDGFDHYNSADILKKWSSYAISSNMIVGGGRNRNCLSTTAYSLAKQITAADESATFILGFAFRLGALPGSSQNCIFALTSDNRATVHLTLSVDGSGALVVKRGGYNGNIIGQENTPSFSSVDVWRYIEFKATLSDTVGVVEVRVDGRPTPVINLTNIDTKNGGTKTTFDSILFNQNLMLPSSGTACDDLYLVSGVPGNAPVDGFLGDCKIEVLYPIAAGTTTGLTSSAGANYDTVNDPLANTTDYVSNNVDDTEDTYTFGDLITPNGTIYGVQANIYAQKTDVGARSVAPVYRHSGTDYDGVDLAVGVGFSYVRELTEQNPGTGTAWTVTDVNNAEFGVKVRP
jgi:hypothetical protein